MRSSLGTFIVGVVLAGTACQDGTPVGPQNEQARLDVTATSIWAEQVVGETGPGSTYSLNVPNEWNGGLVVYAHGYVDPALPVALPNIAALSDALGAQGFAVAYSSYSSTGYDVKDGAQRTHQLSG